MLSVLVILFIEDGEIQSTSDLKIDLASRRRVSYRLNDGLELKMSRNMFVEAAPVVAIAAKA